MVMVVVVVVAVVVPFLLWVLYLNSDMTVSRSSARFAAADCSRYPLARQGR